VAKTERRSNSSDDHALLALFGAIARGASPTDADAKGKSVAAAAKSAWIRDLLQERR